VIVGHLEVQAMQRRDDRATIRDALEKRIAKAFM
jgi:hypothetical protein